MRSELLLLSHHIHLVSLHSLLVHHWLRHAHGLHWHHRLRDLWGHSRHSWLHHWLRHGVDSSSWHHRLSHLHRSEGSSLHLHHSLLMESLSVQMDIGMLSHHIVLLHLGSSKWSDNLSLSKLSGSSLLVISLHSLTSSLIFGGFHLSSIEFLLILRSIFILHLPLEHSKFTLFRCDWV